MYSATFRFSLCPWPPVVLGTYQRSTRPTTANQPVTGCPPLSGVTRRAGNTRVPTAHCPHRLRCGGVRWMPPCPRSSNCWRAIRTSPPRGSTRNCARHGDLLRMSDAVRAGGHREMLRGMVERGELEKLSRGPYRLSGAPSLTHMPYAGCRCRPLAFALTPACSVSRWIGLGLDFRLGPRRYYGLPREYLGFRRVSAAAEATHAL